MLLMAVAAVAAVAAGASAAVSSAAIEAHTAAVAAEAARPAEAEAGFRRALKLRPVQWESALRLGTLMIHHARPAEAEAALRAAAVAAAAPENGARPNSCAIQTNLGVALAGLKRPAEAIAAYDGAAASGRPSCASAMLNAGVLLEEQQQPAGWAAVALDRFVAAAAAGMAEANLQMGLVAARRYRALATRLAAVGAGAEGDLLAAGVKVELLPATMNALLGRLGLAAGAVAKEEAGEQLAAAVRHISLALRQAYPAAAAAVPVGGPVWAEARGLAAAATAAPDGVVGPVVGPGLLVRQVAWMSYGLALERGGLLAAAGSAYRVSAAIAEAGLRAAEEGGGAGKRVGCMRDQAGAAWNNLGNVQQVLLRCLRALPTVAVHMRTPAASVSREVHCRNWPASGPRLAPAGRVAGQLWPGDRAQARCGHPTTLTVLQKHGPSHLGLPYNALSEHQTALITSGCVPFSGC